MMASIKREGIMQKVALYVRTSTDKQEKGLEAQIRVLEEYCKSKGILNYQVYQDFGISGSKSSRPQLDQMMKDVRDEKISTVIVYSFSRFARSTKHLLEALEEFKSLGVSFISLSENVDTNSAIGVAMFTLTG
jgi:site-specific DNA recombinase